METMSRRLRTGTRDLHDEVETRLGLPDSLDEPRHVHELLRRWQALFAEIEDAIGAVEGPSGPAPIAPAGLVLTVDLERLGLAVAAPPGEPVEFEGAAERAGATYVLAGSLLGVASVSRALPDEWTDGIAFLNAAPAAGAPTMTVMRRWLDAWPATQYDQLLVGARRTFRRAGDVLGAGPWSDPLPGREQPGRVAVEVG